MGMLPRLRATNGLLIWPSVLAIMLGVATGSATGASAAGPQAVLIQLKGKATVVRASGKRQAARVPQALLTNDRLVLASGSRGIISYPDRASETVPKDARHLSILIKPATPPASASPFARMWRCLVAAVSRPQAEQATTASHFLSPNKGFSALRPENTRLRTGPVTFSWSIQRAAKYLVTVYQAEEEIWRSPEIRGGKYAYPVEAPALQPGQRYYWEVRGELAGQRLASGRVWFELLPETEAVRLEQELEQIRGTQQTAPDPVARHLSATMLLAAEELWDEAALEASAAQRLRPEDETLRQTLRALLEPPPDQ
ncbi:MAG: hypothetical protein ACYC63_02000 [Armatimonadota bacterium]